MVVANAAVRDNTIALAVYSGSNFKIALLSISNLDVSLQRVLDIDGEVTCLAIEKFGNDLVVLAGIHQDRDPVLAIYSSGLEQPVSGEPILLKLRPGMLSLNCSVCQATNASYSCNRFRYRFSKCCE